MRKLASAFFVIVAITLLVIFLTRKTSASTETANSTTQDLPQKTTEEERHYSIENVIGMEDASAISFIPLRAGETFLSSTGIDLDGDTFDDEILVVRKTNNPYIHIVIGLYNPSTTNYDRISEIRTEIRQVRSFSYSGLDVTGDHRIALVYQGFTDDNQSVLQMYFCRRSGLINIGNFKSDGTIFIQQYSRSETYELSQSTDRSFPVWTYASDTRPGVGNLSQVQTEYDWDETFGRYVQTRQTFVAGKNIAAAELAKIQDGTVQTFANYLNGLWYMTDNEDTEIRYIFFDYDAKEVIFAEDELQEIYNWQDSNLYRNGIYLSTTNFSIENLHRRFDISLTGLDEMRVHIYDDVRMRINTDAVWNGRYRKMNMRKNYRENDELSQDLDSLRERLEEIEQWLTPDGALITFKKGAYNVGGEANSENGVYFVSMIEPNLVLQFNSRSNSSYFGNSYIIEQRTNEETLILKPAKIMSNTAYEISGKTVTLSANK